MSFFLYKPHVHGPHGVTTPDVIIDRFEDGVPALTSETYLSLDAPSCTIRPAVALVPLGAGTILAPIMHIDVGLSVLFRVALRLKHVNVAELQAFWHAKPIDVNVPLEERRERGIACAHDIGPQVGVAIKGAVRIDLSLVCAKQRLNVSLHLRHAEADKAVTAQPQRYAVGPQHGDVKHYI